MLADRVPDAVVRLVGRGPGPEIESLASERVTVVGQVPDIAVELSSACVYAGPLTRGTGMKNKVLEAMAVGLPVVATPLAAEGLEPGVGLVVVTDSGEAAEALARFLDDRVAAAGAGRDNRRRMTAGRTWAASAASLEAVWEDVVAEPRGASS